MKSSRVRSEIARTFVALGYPGFRVLWIGCLLSNIGGWMQRVAQPWLVLSLTQSPFLLGLDAFAGDIPLLLLLAWGGVVADRRSDQRRRIVFWSHIVQLVIAALTAGLIWTGQINVWTVILFSLIVGVAQAFSVPAYHAMIPTLVRDEHLPNAIALNSMQFNLSRIVGPVLAGMLMASVGAAWCFAINAVSFVAFIVALLRVRPHAFRRARTIPEAESAVPEEGVPTENFGFGVIFARRDLRGLLAIIGASSLFCGPLITFIPVLVRDIHGAGAGGFSLALACFGVGALLGALSMARGRGGAATPRSVAVHANLFAISVIAASACSSFPFLLVTLFLAGVFFISANAAANTILQSSVTDRQRGRASSLFVLAFRGALPLGNLVTGAMVSRWGAQPSLVANGVVALFAVAGIDHLSGWRAPRID